MRKINLNIILVAFCLAALNLVSFSLVAQPVITHIEPSAAIAGSTVTIYGKYFDATPANNTVTFAGVTATVISGTAGELVVTVPVATAGPGDVIVTSLSVNSLAYSFTIISASPGAFGNQETITTNADWTRSVYAADLDADGDMDVLSASTFDDKIAWYMNDGAGNFGVQQVITTSAISASAVYAADLDGDGDMDVLSASEGDNKITWYKNDGAGNFGVQQVISNTATWAQSVYAADLDDDGDMDVLSAGETKIVWYKNDGAGGFTIQTEISTSALTEASSVYAADLDGDGDMDVIATSKYDNIIFWHQNDGTGSFGVQQVITSSAYLTLSVSSADLDGDGDMDVLATNYSRISWYQNDGTGVFTEQTNISTMVDGAYSVYAADLDADGDLDILSASIGDDKIAWYENTDGAGSFGSQQIITTSANGASSVYAADINGDGALDVLSASVNDDKIAWYPNDIARITVIKPSSAVPGSTIKVYGNNIAYKNINVTFNGTPGTINITNSTASVLEVVTPNISPGLVDVAITSLSGNSDLQAPTNFTVLASIPPDTAVAQTALSTTTTWATSVYASDLDGDGDMDVLSTSQVDNKIAWYQNDGAGAFTVQTDVTTTALGAYSVKAADLDGDGDMDVISASTDDNKINWYENDGTGSFITSMTIDASIGTPLGVYTADFDGDGDIDVLAAYWSGKIAWYENTDGKGNFGTTQVIASPNGVTSAYAADLDGDGDMDVLATSSYNDEVSWYMNDGSGSFSIPSSSSITTAASGVNYVYAADLDGDGDMDVLSASSSDDKIAWYENNGAGSFGAQQVITNLAVRAWSVYAADMDGDGDMDVLSASSGDQKVAWYENIDGMGNFGVQEIVTTNAASARSVYPADLDGDGDLDVLSASASDSKIAWYKRSFNGNDIVSFLVTEETTNKVIDNINNTVAVEVVNGTDLTSVTPVTTFSPGTSTIISSTDYSTEVTYTITSEIGVSQDWLVNIIPVTDAPTLSLSTAEQSTAGFSWNQSAYVKGYNLDVSTNADFSGIITGYPKSITDAATLSESLSGLTPGTQYYARIRSYNQFNTESDNSSTLSIFTIPTEPVAAVPSSITSTSFQTSWDQVAGADYYILEVSSNDFATLTLRDSIAGLLLADATGLTPLSEYKFRLSAGNISGVSSYSNAIAITTPFTAEESPTIPFELFGGRDDTWNLFSIPYELDNKSISSIFADYDPARHEFDWRIVRYRSNTSDYVNFNTGQVNIGEAYWFNAKENLPVKVGAGQVNSQIPFTKLLSQGWNLIGNPYRINISWQKVISDNPASTGVESVQVFKGITQSTGDIMTPFSGGFVWSDQAASMVIDPQSAGSGGRINTVKRKIEGDDIDMEKWLLDINRVTNNEETKLGGFGMHPQASELKDQYDAMSVPRFFSYTDLSTEHQDYFYPWFATDVVPTTSSYTWAFTLSSNQGQATTQLKWDQAALQGKSAKLYLLDKSSGTLIDMKQQGTHIVDLSNGEFKFDIFFISAKELLLPTDLILGTAYPNPANTLATIPVVLPAEMQINLAIYDISGKLITTLAQGKYAPGVHEFTWDIGNDSQQSISGMYIYRLQLSDSSIPPMQKKIIIR